MFETVDVQQADKTRVKSSCYSHIGRLVGWSGDRHLARIVAMIFQPSLACLSHFPLSVHYSFPRAWRSTGLAARQPFPFLPFVISLAFTLSTAFRGSCGRATDGESARKELRLR